MCGPYTSQDVHFDKQVATKSPMNSVWKINFSQTLHIWFDFLVEMQTNEKTILLMNSFKVWILYFQKLLKWFPYFGTIAVLKTIAKANVWFKNAILFGNLFCAWHLNLSESWFVPWSSKEFFVLWGLLQKWCLDKSGQKTGSFLKSSDLGNWNFKSHS